MTTKARDIPKLHCIVKGSGVPIVLLHGFPLDARVWEGQIEVLSKHYKVIVPDLPGFGKSRYSLPFTLEWMADAVNGMLTEMQAIPCILGGLSMGGYIAQAYARKYAGTLKGLMLIDTRAAADTPEAKQSRTAMIELARTKGASAVADQMMAKMFGPTTAAKNPKLVSELHAIMSDCPALTIQHACAAMRDRDDHMAFLPTIKIPTLVVVGDGDSLTPPGLAETISAAIPGAKLAVIKEAGHMAIMEQPEEVSRVIGEFAKAIAK